MRRRAFMIAISAAAIMWSCTALAGSESKVWRIGVFHVGVDHIPETLEGLRDGLRALGYDVGSAPMPRVSTVVTGSNVRLDWRNLEDEAAAREAAKELVRDRADLIVAVEDQSLRGVRAATPDIPVVFLQVPDPVGEGFVKSLSQPGGNTTGFADFFIELMPKRLELLNALVPGLRRLLVLVDADDPAFRPLLEEIRRATGALKIEPVEVQAREQEDIERAFGSLNPGDVQAVFIASGTLNTRFPTLILKLATERKLAVPFHRRAWAMQGALFSYGPNYPALGRAAAVYVDKVLRGTKPADLPVQRATDMELIINLKTAKALGLSVPQSILARADEVIE
jgi:putative ABC transport system substrate-binding protein